MRLWSRLARLVGGLGGAALILTGVHPKTSCRSGVAKGNRDTHLACRRIRPVCKLCKALARKRIRRRAGFVAENGGDEGLEGVTPWLTGQASLVSEGREGTITIRDHAGLGRMGDGRCVRWRTHGAIRRRQCAWRDGANVANAWVMNFRRESGDNGSTALQWRASWLATQTTTTAERFAVARAWQGKTG